MAIEFNGSSQYLSVNSALLTDEPIDMLGHFNSDSSAVTQTLVALSDNAGVNGEYSLLPAGAVAFDPIRVIKRNDAGTGGIFDTTTGYTAGTWHVGAASFISDTDRAAYIDGGSKQTNFSNVSNPTNDNLSIGARVHSSVDLFFDGKIAEIYVLNTNMNDAKHAVRAKGYSALWDVPIKNVKGWYTLLRTTDLQNRMGNGYPTLTATATPTRASHPSKVIYPRIGALICL